MNLLRSIWWPVLGLSLVFYVVGFLYDGLGGSRVSGYWHRYHGALSWPQYRITFQPGRPGQHVGRSLDSLATGPAPSGYSLLTLRYGFDLYQHAPLRGARLLQSELPAADLAPVLYDTTAFAGFSPDSVYYAWVGLRGNYFSLPFGARPVFVLHSYRAALAPAHVPHYGVRTAWRQPWLLYAWAALSLQLLFFAAAAAVLALEEHRRPADRLVAALLVLLFVAAATYVDWLDYQTAGEWPIFKPLLNLLLLVGYVYVQRAPVTAPADGPEPGAAQA